MSFRIKIEIPHEELGMIEQRLRGKIESARHDLVRSATTASLSEIISTVPVETGEARQGWQSELNRMEGAQPLTLATETSLLSATNNVEHIVYLEYGTSKMAPRRIVGNAIESIRSVIHTLFRIPS